MINENSFLHLKRKSTSYISQLFIIILSFISISPFLFIVHYVFLRGIDGLSFDFLMHLPKGPGEEGGGMANGILGSISVVSIASIIGIPWGILIGIFLSEYRYSKLSRVTSFFIDILSSVPSIVIGIFIYGLIVVKYGFSAYAGGLSLMIIMIPIISRSTEEILKLVPTHIREAGLGLGIPRWKVTLRIVLPGVRWGILSGIMLSIARVSGETAPLLFTSFGNQYFARNLDQATATLPVQIYNFAKSGFIEWESLAWTGALVLLGFIIIINLGTRLIINLIRKDWAKGSV